MSTLIALLSGISTGTPVPPTKAHFQFWNAILLPCQIPGNTEVAVLLPGILGATDEFSAEFRRFSLVGQSLDEKIRNAFELGFEKGFDHVVLVREDWDSVSTPLLIGLLDSLLANKIGFAAANDGSLAGWGMRRVAFWNWPRFDSYEKDVVVEMISICMDQNIPYQLITP